MVLDHEVEHPSRWAAVSSVPAKIGCSQGTLNEWVRKIEVDRGKRVGLPSDVAEKMKALERENCQLRRKNDTMPCCGRLPWLHNLNHTVSDKPGAVQSVVVDPSDKLYANILLALFEKP